MTLRLTYRALGDYSQLMPRSADTKQLLVPAASIQDTVRLIKRVMAEQGTAMQAIARHLRGEGPHSPEQHAYNVWHFTKAHLHYKLDPQNWEDVRTPARSWADRALGVDCEDYSLFMAAIMQAMGYGPRMAFAIVALETAGSYGHIYPVLMDHPVRDAIYSGRAGGIAMDRLLGFNQHPQTVKETMQLALLSGLPAPSADSAMAQKVQWLKLAPAEDRQLIAEMLPYVKAITPGGGIVWVANAPFANIADMAADYETEKAYGLNGLGAIGAFKKKKQERPPARPARPVKAVPAAIARVTPIVILGRAAFLLLVKMNAFKLARILRLVFLDEATAERSKLNLTEWRKLRSRRDKVLNTWKQIGGKEKELKQAIAKGAHVKVQSLGVVDPVTIAAMAGAAPVLAAVVAAVGKDHNLKEMTKGSEEADLAALGSSVGEAIGKIAEVAKERKRSKDGKGGKDDPAKQAADAVGLPTDDEGGGEEDKKKENTKPTTEGGNTTLYVVGGLALVAVVGGGYYLSQQQKPKR